MNLKELILRYGILLPRRFYKKEKLRFLYAVKTECEKQGWQVSLQQDKKKQSEANNLIIGNLKSAKYVVVVHYDTPAKQFIKKEEVPFDRVKSTIANYMNESIPLLLISLIAFGGFYFIGSLTLVNGLSFVFYILLALALIYCVVKLIRGYPERHNLQNNSAAIALAMSLLDSKNKDAFALAFTDQECVNHHGDMILAPLIKNKVIIHLSNLCAGDTILLTSTKQNEAYCNKFSQSLSIFDVMCQVVNDDQIEHHSLKSYPTSISIMLGKKLGQKVTIYNNGKSTNEDVNINMLEKLSECIKKIINEPN